MLLEAYAGETFRVSAKNLTHTTEGPITSGAVVMIGIYDATDTLVGTEMQAGNNNDANWYADFLIFEAGTYVVRVNATMPSSRWRGKGYVRLKQF
jgi:hypothetical protein